MSGRKCGKRVGLSYSQWLGYIALMAVTALPVAAEEPFDSDIGFDGNRNFSVFAPRGEFCARRVRECAQRHRDQIALDWLGHQLAEGTPYTNIYVRFTHSENARTILGNPQRPPHDNQMYLDVPDAEAAVGEALAHEMAHVVTRGLFPAQAPHWVMEGIACQYDGDAARAPRTAFLKRQLAKGQLPSLHRMFDVRVFAHSDVASYAVAESLTDYLLTRGDRRQFVTFARRLALQGIDDGLSVYSIESVDQLQSLWEAWARRHYAPSASDNR